MSEFQPGAAMNEQHSARPTDEQTTPEKDAELAEWHQQRFLEANKPKRTNADKLRDLMDAANREPTIFRDGTGRS